MPRGARRSHQPGPASTAPPGARPDGFAAHRTLLAIAVRGLPQTVSRRAPLELPPLPPTPAWQRVRDPEFAQAWTGAVEEHCRLAGASSEEAQTALAGLAEHLERASRLPWAIEPGLFDRATEECLRHSVFAARVSSAPAQRAWEAWWSEQPYGPTAGPRDSVLQVRREADRERTLRAQWTAAWAVWAARTRLRL